MNEECLEETLTMGLFSIFSDQILIFSSPEQSSILESSTEFLVDGTFDVS